MRLQSYHVQEIRISTLLTCHLRSCLFYKFVVYTKYKSVIVKIEFFFLKPEKDFYTCRIFTKAKKQNS